MGGEDLGCVVELRAGNEDLLKLELLSGGNVLLAGASVSCNAYSAVRLYISSSNEEKIYSF